MDVREQRGREIAERMRIVKRNDAWVVPSQSGEGSYRVTLESDDIRCTCADFDLRRKPCKHIFAAAFVVQRQTVTETTTVKDGETTTTTVTKTETAAVRVTYKQDWANYNRAQTLEKELFCRLLHDLALGVPEPVQQKGRPRIPMAEGIFSACYKVYSGFSSRRFMTDLREAHANGLVSKPWHFNTVLGVIEDPELTPILTELVSLSAAPLRSVETDFAVDSTGFGTQCFYRHFTAKYGHDQLSRDYIKLHAVVGVKTNVVAAAVVTDRDSHDHPQFRPLVEKASQDFTMKALSADKAYNSHDSVNLVASIGAEAFIPFRHNAKESSRDVPNSPVWRKLFHLYNYQRDEFLARYHMRSNAESTFSAMKRLFGDTLRSKTMVAQMNELLFMTIAYNITCVVHSIFELGVEMPGFPACTRKEIAAPKLAS